MRAIVVGVDGSRRSLNAARYAAILAKQFDGTLLVVHVSATAAAVPRAVSALGVALDRSGARWRLQVRMGDPGHELTRSARTAGAALVVIGGSSPGWPHRPCGPRGASVLEWLWREGVPVLVVNQEG